VYAAGPTSFYWSIPSRKDVFPEATVIAYFVTGRLFSESFTAPRTIIGHLEYSVYIMHVTRRVRKCEFLCLRGDVIGGFRSTWDVTLSLGGGYRHFEGTCRLSVQGFSIHMRYGK